MTRGTQETQGGERTRALGTGVTPGRAEPGPPRCLRRSSGKVLGGVASGVADHLRLDPLHVRLAFVVLTLLAGAGPLMYAVLWIVLPQESGVGMPADAAGLDAMSRSGLRSGATGRGRTPLRAREDAGQIVAIVIVGVGALLLLQHLRQVSPAVFWPVIVGGAGLALLWRQADDAQQVRRSDADSRALRGRWFAVFVGPGGWRTLGRGLVGLVLVFGAGAIFLAAAGQVSGIAQTLLALLIGLVGIALIVGPWAWRLVRDLDAERGERVRSQERADMAAHLHDSVLQTLALIQKQAHDPKSVVRLARAQERDLRGWLYGEADDPDTTLRSALQTAAAEVEESHGTPVEVVAVGDAPLDSALTAVLRAAREAVVNAAKHSRAPTIDVYLEVDPDTVEVFVRDRGVGFDPDVVPEDRFGVRRSIHERMERHGGQAEVRSESGSGTEVRLSIRRSSQGAGSGSSVGSGSSTGSGGGGSASSGEEAR